jgi:membrane-bound metal-dependent hydrolase YbcI (DUF457 family)
LARAGLGRRVPYATATLILASNAPDADVVAAFRGGVEYLAAHRGPTHGPVGIIALGLVSAAIVSAYAQWRSRRFRAHVQAQGAAQFKRWWVLAMIGTACHVLMDVPTSYGTRMLSPFVWTWYALDWMPIIDVYLWVVLIVTLSAGSVTRGRHRAALIALGLMALDYTARAALHERALASGAMFDAAGVRAPCATAPTFVAHPSAMDTPLAGRDSCVEAAALPTFLSPFTWRIVRHQPSGYELSDRSVFDTAAHARPIRLVSQSGPDVRRARSTRAGLVYLDFARFPISQISSRTPMTTTVRLLDARFIVVPAGQQAAAARGSLMVVVELDASGRVVHQRFGN